MKKTFLCTILFSTLIFGSCLKKEELVDSSKKPEWLGESIYKELTSGDQSKLTGTFNNYVRLIDDLGYSEVLSRTGSKTVFPANDDAFARFFADTSGDLNPWGVRSYEQLSYPQKKVLLYSSMLDNALLVGMLQNVSSGTNDVAEGRALKHATNLSVIDSITKINPENVPGNNKMWDVRRSMSRPTFYVSDNTTPMLVHFTREQMVNNNITTMGGNSDFAIITGEEYDPVAKNAYIYNDKVINADITCQNGYIHQVKEVLVQPGNISQALQRQNNTKYFSHIMDYFCAPYYDDATTKNYRDWARQYPDLAASYGISDGDSIFQVRYLSERSQNAKLARDPNNKGYSDELLLTFDPAWNEFYPKVSGSSSIDNTIVDMAAIFVPTDQAFKDYFVDGEGREFVEVYKPNGVPNDAEHLMQNLDTLYAHKPSIIASFIKNLMQTSMIGSVPSKFSSINNDVSEALGVTVGDITRKGDKYDIVIANNGIIYKLNRMIAPDRYNSVLAPSSTFPYMRVMNWAINDWHSPDDQMVSYLSLDFQYYLLAIKANFGLFVPTDFAFAGKNEPANIASIQNVGNIDQYEANDVYYLDPTQYNSSTGAKVLRFYYDDSRTNEPFLACKEYEYNKATGQIGQNGVELPLGSVSSPNLRIKSALTDILNNHTVVLENGQTIGSNHYYKTKDGGEVYVTGGADNSKVYGGLQYDILKDGSSNQPFGPATITTQYPKKNGKAYRIDRVIQPTIKGVTDALSKNDQFSEFYQACAGFSAAEILTWIGISGIAENGMPSDQDRMQIFTTAYEGTSGRSLAENGNVKMFKTYNYTLYAPNNDAMNEAFQKGLPRWSEIQEYYEANVEENPDGCPEPEAGVLRKKVEAIRDFCRYHFQSEALYADNTLQAEGNTFKTMLYNAFGLAYEINVTGGGNILTVTDGAGNAHVINANNSSLASNIMTRDIWLNANRANASAITTSSYCVIHEIDKPLYRAGGRFDAAWRNNNVTKSVSNSRK